MKNENNKQKDFMISCAITTRVAATPTEAKRIANEFKQIPKSGTVIIYKVVKRWKKSHEKKKNIKLPK